MMQKEVVISEFNHVFKSFTAIFQMFFKTRIILVKVIPTMLVA